LVESGWRVSSFSVTVSIGDLSFSLLFLLFFGYLIYPFRCSPLQREFAVFRLNHAFVHIATENQIPLLSPSRGITWEAKQRHLRSSNWTCYLSIVDCSISMIIEPREVAVSEEFGTPNPQMINIIRHKRGGRSKKIIPRSCFRLC
jgi:hypothetical protein